MRMWSMEPCPKSTSTSISEDLWPEILAKLPAKVLCRLRCVCRRWNSLITSPFLVNLHHSATRSSTTPLHLQVPSLRACSDSQYAVYYHLAGDPKRRIRIHFPFKFGDVTRSNFPQKGATFRFRFAGVVRGLVCLSYHLGSYFDFTVLWNPAIRKYIRLPHRPLPPHLQTAIADSPHVLYLPGTVRFNCQALGFYYDTDFKVVRLWIPRSDLFTAWHCTSPALQRPLCEVYSARDGRWREVPFTPTGSILNQPWILDITKSRAGLFISGAVHWIATRHGHRGDFVLVFECEPQEFGAMELPDAMRPRDHVHPRIDLFQYKGMLSTLVQPTWENNRALDLWVMPEYCSVSSWNKLFRLLPPDWSNCSSLFQQPAFALESKLEQILNHLAYQETLFLMDHPKAQSYAKDEIVFF